MKKPRRIRQLSRTGSGYPSRSGREPYKSSYSGIESWAWSNILGYNKSRSNYYFRSSASKW